MTKLLGAAFIAALVAVGLFVFLSGSPSDPVRATRVERGDVESVLRTNGRVRAAERVEVFAGAAGVVRDLRVAAGDRVQRGGILAVLDNAEARAAVATAEARVAQAHARLIRARTLLTPAERTELEAQVAEALGLRHSLAVDRQSLSRLVEGGASPRSELDSLDRLAKEQESRLNLLRSKLAAEPPAAVIDEASAAFREAAKTLAEAQRVAAAAVIRAPIAGKAYSLAVEPGQFVAAGSQIARIAGDGAVEVVVFVDEPELGRVEPGATARLTASAYPGRQWRCVVDRGPTEVIELGTRRVGQVLCRVEGESDQLIPNLTVDVEISGESASSVWMLPRESLIRTETGDAVWIASDGVAARRTVQVGVRGANRVEIVSGLGEQDVVLLPGGRPLSEGDRVEPSIEGAL